MASHYGVEGIPNIVLIGVPNVAALKEAASLLSAAAIPHWEWDEPDFDYGFTAICTAAISGEQRRVLAHYRLWEPAKDSVAQLAEQRTLRALAEGSNPS